ncbi:MAG: SH3 domain-containing protein [Christensenellales bacterium]|nr:SH3 domain-containing protein [Christensenellales bacterium]
MMKFAKTWKKAAALVMMLMLVSSVALAEVSAIVLNPKTSIYFAPNESSAKVGQLGFGERLTIESNTEEWARINWNGYIGYTKLENLCSLARMKARVAVDSPVLYISRGSMTPRWMNVGAGATVYVCGARNGCWLISDEHMNLLGYIPMNCVHIL